MLPFLHEGNHVCAMRAGAFAWMELTNWLLTRSLTREAFRVAFRATTGGGLRRIHQRGVRNAAIANARRVRARRWREFSRNPVPVMLHCVPCISPRGENER